MTDKQQKQFYELHDQLILCGRYLHLRGAAEVIGQLRELAASGFDPENMHDDGCPSCRKYREYQRERPS